MSFSYTAPIPGSQVRKDFLIGNRLLRAIWGFTNRAPGIEFTVYLAHDGTENWPDRQVTDPGATAGLVSSIRRVSSAAPAREVELVLDGGSLGEVTLASWVAPDSRSVFVSVSAPDASVDLRFPCPDTARMLASDGTQLDPGAPIPAGPDGSWQFCLSWDERPAGWVSRESVVASYEASTAGRTRVSMDNAVLAERANLIAATLEVSRRIDGRLPAGAHRAYDGAWIRDGVMDCIGMMYAGCPDMGNTLLYLLKNVPPKEGQLEENGMMVFGLYHYWMATGDDALIRDHLPLLRGFVHDLFRPEFIDPGTGLLASGTEGYWERNWLGKACELSQNAWAVLAVRLYTELGTRLGWDDDYDSLNSAADTLWATTVSDSGFVRGGRFVKRLFPGGEHQPKGLAKRGLSMGGNTYADQFASPRDFEDVMEDLDPDVQTSVPWLWGLMDPGEPVCAATAEEMWKLWNQDWGFGGLERYSVFADCDRETAGPWFLASMMAARAFALRDDYEKVSRIIEWTDREFLGCGWSERISRAHPVDDPERYVHEVLNWPGGEYLMLIYREAAGLYPTSEGLTIRPHLPPDFAGLAITNFLYRGLRYSIRYHGTGSSVRRIEFNGRTLDSNVLPLEDGEADVYLA